MKKNYMWEYESPEINICILLSEGAVLSGSSEFTLGDLSREEGARMGANEMNLARLTADILANQFE